MDQSALRFRRVDMTNEAYKELKCHRDKISDCSEIDEVIFGIRYHLERNADICDTVEGTNVRCYKARPMRSGFSVSVLFRINDRKVEICRVLHKKLGEN